MRTVERAIVEAIVTAVPMIDSTIEWSTLPLTVVPTLIPHHLPPGTDGFIPRHTVPTSQRWLRQGDRPEYLPARAC